MRTRARGQLRTQGQDIFELCALLATPLPVRFVVVVWERICKRHDAILDTLATWSEMVRAEEEEKKG